MSRALVIVAAVIVAGAAVAFSWSDPAQTRSPEASESTEDPGAKVAATSDPETPDPTQPTHPETRGDAPEKSDPSDPYGFVLDTSKLTAEELNRTIVLADGSRVWALNGCVDTENLMWSADRTRAPIVAIEKGPRYDYYRHADGACMTTYDVKTPDGTWAAAGTYWVEAGKLPTTRMDRSALTPVPNGSVPQRPKR